VNALTQLFAIGFAAGLALAIPVGPMAIMLINTTIAKGWRHGVVGALAMASVDCLYAATVFFIGGSIAAWLHTWSLFLSLGGALILLYLGLSTLIKNLKLLRADSADESRSITQGSRRKTYLTFFGATVVNPPTALYFLAIAPSVATLATESIAVGGFAFAIGVFAGSIVWQESLAVAGVGLRAITRGALRAWIGALGGVLIIALAVTMALRALA
jgi:threonine/homoserine/homoserine lactone efflux protein